MEINAKFSIEGIEGSKLKISIHIKYKGNIQSIGKSNDKKTKVALIFILVYFDFKVNYETAGYFLIKYFSKIIYKNNL